MSTEENKGLGRLWKELNRRRVIRVTVLYAIAGWIVIEVSSTVLPNLNLPEWSVTLVTRPGRAGLCASSGPGLGVRHWARRSPPDPVSES